MILRFINCHLGHVQRSFFESLSAVSSAGDKAFDFLRLSNKSYMLPNPDTTDI